MTNGALALVEQQQAIPEIVEQADTIAYFDDKELRLFIDIMNTQSKSGNTTAMRRLIKRKAREFGATRVWSEKDNVYAIKGDAALYPCMVAHTDTVHSILPPAQYKIAHNKARTEWWAYDPTREVKGKDDKTYPVAVGIGGDDKVGIFIALNMMRTHSVMKCAFFRDEENGCNGARDADMSFFADTTLVLECDRRGYGDFVNRIGGVELQSKEFEKAVAPILSEYKFKNVNGMSTDVQELKRRGLGVCAANMSCGYYAPHGPQEYINEQDVISTYDMCAEIIETIGHQLWAHKYEVPKYTHTSTYQPAYDYKKKQAETEVELVKQGYTRSAYGFWYQYVGDGDDPYAIVPQVQLSLDATGGVVVTADPSLLKDATGNATIDLPGESVYSSRLAAAIQREHEDLNPEEILAIVKEHYEELTEMAKVSLLIDSDLDDDFYSMIQDQNSSPFAKPEPRDLRPTQCPGCEAHGSLLAWDGLEKGWACPCCHQYADVNGKVFYGFGM